jgi:hypothetical protein
MSATVAGAMPDHVEEADAPASTQVGAVSFSDLVRAHYKRERERKRGETAAAEQADEEFQQRLKEFQDKEGSLAAVYWSTRNASAIAMTVGNSRGRRNPLVDTENEVRLHRVTDWVTKDAEPVADVLHACDLLAIRVGEILRGTSERIAMRWLYAVQEHVLGYIERTPAHETGEREHDLIVEQRRELSRIEDYYLRAGAKAGRIVYVTGMLVGAMVIAVACAIVAIVLTRAAHRWNHDVQVLLLCTSAGAVGALVSVLSRMSGGSDKFTVDFEVGRPLLRRLGLYKPLVGSVFGLALYFLLVSGILMTQPPKGHTLYFYAIVAFLAGFSERFTGVMFGNAERLLSGNAEQPAPTPTAK